MNGIDDDKFINSIMFYTEVVSKSEAPNQCFSLLQCIDQSKYRFGFIPLTDPVLPQNRSISSTKIEDSTELLKQVTRFINPNFIGANTKPITTEY